MTLTIPQEDGFHVRPSIKLPIPDHIKAVLVDDWENVTKNNQLVPLPHPHPVNEIIDDYIAWEEPGLDHQGPAPDILLETMAGLKDYFDKALGRILLYRYISTATSYLCLLDLTLARSFERLQYHEIRQVWEKAEGEKPHKSAVDTYGAEHLSRLLGKYSYQTSQH